MAKGDFSTEYNGQGLKVKQIRIAAGKALVKQREAIVGHVFGTIKRGMDAGYCLTGGCRKRAGSLRLLFLRTT
jgi:hypothetical protein